MMNAAGVEDLAEKYLLQIHQKLGKEYSHQAYVHVMGFVGFVKYWEMENK